MLRSFDSPCNVSILPLGFGKIVLAHGPLSIVKLIISFLSFTRFNACVFKSFLRMLSVEVVRGICWRWVNSVDVQGWQAIICKRIWLIKIHAGFRRFRGITSDSYIIKPSVRLLALHVGNSLFVVLGCSIFVNLTLGSGPKSKLCIIIRSILIILILLHIRFVHN